MNSCNIDDTIFFNVTVLNRISREVTHRLRPYSCDGRPIVVPNPTIYTVMVQLYRQKRPFNAGLINDLMEEDLDDYIESIIQDVINVIYKDVAYNLSLERRKTWNKWDTLTGEQNKHGLMPLNVPKMVERPRASTGIRS